MQFDRLRVVIACVAVGMCQNVSAAQKKNWRSSFQSYHPSLLDSPGAKRRQEIFDNPIAKAFLQREKLKVIGQKLEWESKSPVPFKSLLSSAVAHLQPIKKADTFQDSINDSYEISGAMTRNYPADDSLRNKRNVFVHCAALRGPSPSPSDNSEIASISGGSTVPSADEMELERKSPESSDSSEYCQNYDDLYQEFLKLTQKYQALKSDYKMLQARLQRECHSNSGSLTRSIPGSRNLSELLVEENE